MQSVIITINGIQLQYVAIELRQALASTLSGEPQSVCYQAMVTLVKTPKAPVCFSIPPQVTDQLGGKFSQNLLLVLAVMRIIRVSWLDLHSLVMNQSSGRRCKSDPGVVK